MHAACGVAGHELGAAAPREVAGEFRVPIILELADLVWRPGIGHADQRIRDGAFRVIIELPDLAALSVTIPKFANAFRVLASELRNRDTYKHVQGARPLDLKFPSEFPRNAVGTSNPSHSCDVDRHQHLLYRRIAVDLVRAHIARPVDDVARRIVDGRQALEELRARQIAS